MKTFQFAYALIITKKFSSPFFLFLAAPVGLGLGRVLGLNLGRQDVPGFKNTGVNFLASGRPRQDIADPMWKSVDLVLYLALSYNVALNNVFYFTVCCLVFFSFWHFRPSLKPWFGSSL